MSVVVKAPYLQEVKYVMENLRKQSREEIDMQGLHPTRLIQSISNNPLTWCVYAGDAPAALVGASPVHEGMYALFGFGTDRWVDVWKLVTLVSRRDMFRAVKATGAHRAHAVSPAHHRQTHRWLKVLGAEHEVDLPRWGINGEDFKMFSWLAN